jgi:hypothetical protein
MYIKNLFFSLVVTAFIGACYCQEVGTNYKTLKDFESELHFGNSRSVQFTIGESSSITEGSEYLEENFVNGEILTSQSDHFTDIPMRYNAFKDEIEVKLHDSIIYGLTDPSRIQQILLRNKVLIHKDFYSESGKNSGYLFVLYQGNSSLCCRNTKIFKERIPSNGITPETPARIIDRPKEYYIQIKNELPRIFSSKKDLLQLLGSHSTEVENFLKKEKVKLNRDEDLIKVLTYYDSL